MADNAILRQLSATIGWIYVVCWSVSFYPQVWLNYRRQSTSGLSIDFIVGSILGFLYLGIFYAFFYGNNEIQHAYRTMHNGTHNVVQVQDVVFAFHALALSLVLFLQVLLYRRPTDQLLTLTGSIVLGSVLAVTAVLLALYAASVLPWISVLYAFSYIKFFITVYKYSPQAFLNYKRKSTVGWSIGNVLLDFAGGLCSIVQLVLDTIISGDMTSISGNSIKLSLGLICVAFDLLFMLQHYVLYPQRPLLIVIADPLDDDDGAPFHSRKHLERPNEISSQSLEHQHQHQQQQQNIDMQFLDSSNQLEAEDHGHHAFHQNTAALQALGHSNSLSVDSADHFLAVSSTPKIPTTILPN